MGNKPAATVDSAAIGQPTEADWALVRSAARALPEVQCVESWETVTFGSAKQRAKIVVNAFTYALVGAYPIDAPFGAAPLVQVDVYRRSRHSKVFVIDPVSSQSGNFEFSLFKVWSISLLVSSRPTLTREREWTLALSDPSLSAKHIAPALCTSHSHSGSV
jgi:hypothetical protein